MYNHSDLDPLTEWDLSVGNVSGTKSGFPSTLIYTPKNTLGPPASYKYAGSSTLTTEKSVSATAPYSISFWLNPDTVSATTSTIFKTNKGSDLEIKLNHGNRKLTISGNEVNTALPNKFSLIVINVDSKIEISINGSTIEQVSSTPKTLNGIITLLTGYRGLFSDFKIYDKTLSQKEIEILYRTIIALKINSINAPLIRTTSGLSEIPMTDRNTIGKNMTYNLDGIYEYFEAGMGSDTLEFNINNITEIGDYTTNNATIIQVPTYNAKSLDTLYALQLDIRVNSAVTNAEITALGIITSNRYPIQSRIYSTISANTWMTLFLVFKPYSITVSNIEINLKKMVGKTDIRNVSLVDLTNSGIENYLREMNLGPVFSSNAYTIPNTLLNWCNTNIRDKVSTTLTIQKNDNPLAKLNNPVKNSGFGKFGKRVGVISETVNEHTIHF